MENDGLKESINELKESVDSLIAVQKDIFNTDTSTDDISSLRGKIHELMQSNEELRIAILALNASVKALSDTILKR